MSDETQISVENLLLASLLIAGGARLSSIESGDRLSKVFLSVDGLDREKLSLDLSRLAESVRNQEELSVEAWDWLFNSSVLGTMESEYRRLKRLVVNQRSKR